MTKQQGEKMTTDKSHKTLQYMIEHFNRIKILSPTMFYSALNDLTLLANSNAGNDILSNYDKKIHTPQFFVDLLLNLGYNKDGSPLNE